MKRCAFYAVLLAAILNTNSPVRAADSDQTNITITGFAQNVCKLSGQIAASDSQNSSFAGSVYTITNFIDQNTAFPLASSGTITLAQAYCNYGTNVQISSTNAGLKNTGNQIAPSDFVTKIDYVVSASWGTVTLPVLNTASTPNATVTKDSGAANKGDIVLQITTPALNSPALAGTFTDVLTIKIGAQI